MNGYRYRVFTAENNVFICDEVRYEPEDVGKQTIIFVCFVARNGMDKGREHRVPLMRVTRIVDMQDKELAA